jgi:hypothetical protein
MENEGGIKEGKNTGKTLTESDSRWERMKEGK